MISKLGQEDAEVLEEIMDTGESLFNRLNRYVTKFEKNNPNPAVQALHPEFLLLKECLGVVEAMIEFVDEED